MSAQLIDGKQVAAEIQATLTAEIEQISASGARAPCIAVILVGENPASQVYVGHKHRAAKRIGMKSMNIQLDGNISESALLAEISKLNQDPDVDGILVQLPLPQQIDSEKILESIDPYKDVDGFHPYNIGRLAQRLPALRPCTPYGIIKLLESIDVPIMGANAVIVGASNIVGRPMALELLMYGATVTVCHRFTPQQSLIAHCQQADILIVAVGKAGLIEAEWIRPGSTVIDVGINRDDDGTLHGDVNFAEACNKAAYITPVPGGVGPMTVTMLLQNTLSAYLNQTKTDKIKRPFRD